MRVEHDNRVYRIDWQHIPDAEKTAAFIAEHAPKGRINSAYKGHIPLKAKNVIGMCVCRVALQEQPGTETEKPVYTTISTGHSFQHHTDRFYDKAVARRVSLRDALGQNLTFFLRQAIWAAFNKQWPPVRPETGQWERRYVKANMELLDMQRLNQELYKRVYGAEVSS